MCLDILFIYFTAYWWYPWFFYRDYNFELCKQWLFFFSNFIKCKCRVQSLSLIENLLSLQISTSQNNNSKSLINLCMNLFNCLWGLHLIPIKVVKYVLQMSFYCILADIWQILNIRCLKYLQRWQFLKLAHSCQSLIEIDCHKRDSF